MSEKFEKPKIVMVSSLDIKFPNICPVCGEPANTPNNIVVSDAAGSGTAAVKSSPTYDAYNRPVYSGKDPFRKMGGKLKVFIVPSCSQHALKIKKGRRSNLKTIFGLLLFILPFLGLYTFLWSSLNIQNGESILMPISIFIVYFVIVSILGYFTYRKSILEKYLDIIHVDSVTKIVFLKIRNKAYYEEFMKINYPNAKDYSKVKGESK